MGEMQAEQFQHLPSIKVQFYQLTPVSSISTPEWCLKRANAPDLLVVAKQHLKPTNSNRKERGGKEKDAD